MSEAPEPESTPADAYSLLSKPTLEISDDEALLIIADLRKRREGYLRTGKPDRQPKVKAEPKAKPDKAANTASLLAQLEASAGQLKLG